MKIFIFSIFILSLLGVTVSFAEEIKAVTIRDEKFEVVKKLQSTVEVLAFSEEWHQKIKQISGDHHWKFKIDIEPGTRWLFDPEGYVRVLSKNSSASDYKIKSIDAFNKILGVSAN